MQNIVSRRALLLALGALPLVSLAQRAPKIAVEVWKDSGCGCCKEWVKHLEQNGFSIVVHDSGNAQMRAKLGIPQKFGSCHTALVGGYAVEGHVPARDIQRLLKERPTAVGLAAPGMPVGSPGMDDPAYAGRRDPHDILLVLKTGEARVFASYNRA
jgi:hypothetical protein